MAQLNSRGTVTRNRWDFYERSNGFSFIYGSTNASTIGAYLANNSTGAANLDIFNITWFSSSAEVFEIAFLPPPITIVPLAPTESFIHPLIPDAAAPPGVAGMFSGLSSVYWTILRYSNKSQGDEAVPIPGSYFITLPPAWAVAVYSDSASGTSELSMTVWYQYVTDNISPAV